jgi:hypothetical protein
VELHDTAPPAPVSQTPAIGGTSAARLARAVGAHAETEADGTQSITFPSPGTPSAAGVPDYVPFSTAPVTVSRSPLDGLGSQLQHAAGDLVQHAEQAGEHVVDQGASALSSAASSVPHPTPAPPAPAAGMDVDEIADTVIEKLRRELLLEQELGGGAMDLI